MGNMGSAAKRDDLSNQSLRTEPVVHKLSAPLTELSPSLTKEDDKTSWRFQRSLPLDAVFCVVRKLGREKKLILCHLPDGGIEKYGGPNKNCGEILSITPHRVIQRRDHKDVVGLIEEHLKNQGLEYALSPIKHPESPDQILAYALSKKNSYQRYI